MSATLHSTPRLNQGAYLISDAARILQLPAATLRSWMNGRSGEEFRHFPAGEFQSHGRGADRHFGFHTLIELFTIAQLRQRSVSMATIRAARSELIARFNTPHPFALGGLMTSGRSLLKALDEDCLLELGKNGQVAFSKVLEPFCASLDFDQASSLANRYFPLGRDKPVVVDPRHGFGRPVIEGTNIATEAIMSLLRGGETVEDVAESYQIAKEAVLAAKAFEQQAA